MTEYVADSVESQADHTDSEARAIAEDDDYGLHFARRLSTQSTERLETGVQVRPEGQRIRDYLSMGGSQATMKVGGAMKAGAGRVTSTMSGASAHLQRMFRCISSRDDGRGRSSSRGKMRNSQHSFAEQDQTAIILDWDDTLFPTSYLRGDLGLAVKTPVSEQPLSRDEQIKLAEIMANCAEEAKRVLGEAAKHGKVFLVTLARPPWLSEACRVWYPSVGQLIDELGLDVVYAQEGIKIEKRKLNEMQQEEFEAFWSDVKGKAIERVLEQFYSQYEGQSWKNVISIGDSVFERRGTMNATLKYAQSIGIADHHEEVHVGKGWAFPSRTESCGSISGTVNNHFHKIRTKTFQMLEGPSGEELVLQLKLLSTWLPRMVGLDDGFDIDCNGLTNLDVINKVESTLRHSATR